MKEQRRQPRTEVCLDVDWNGYHSRMADLSEGGCYIDSIAEVAVGEILPLKVRMPNGEWLGLTGQVAQFTPRLGFGVRFIDLSHEQQRWIRLLIRNAKTGKTEPGELFSTDSAQIDFTHRNVM